MNLDELSISEIARALQRIEANLEKLRLEMQADSKIFRDQLGLHDVEIALVKAAVGGWRQWTGAGIVAGLTGLVEWFFHRASS